MLRKIFMFALITGFISLPSFAQTATDKQIGDTTISVKIKGITCSGDLTTLADNVKEIAGVSSVIPGKAAPKSIFKISYNPALVKTSQIYAAIENTAGCSDPKDRPYKVKN